VQRDKFDKKLEEKLAKKDQEDALANKTEKMKTEHREEKKRIRNDTASDKDQLMKKIKNSLNGEHRAGVAQLNICDFKIVKMSAAQGNILVFQNSFGYQCKSYRGGS
jgi:hypothetical protein